MSWKASDETKRKRGMGGVKNGIYLPYTMPSEYDGTGVNSVFRDWKTGDVVSCHSQIEAMIYYELRWDDNNVAMMTQYPLNNRLTTDIADELGFAHPCSRDHVMTTNIVAREADGTLHAYSVKSNSKLKPRQMEIMCIEKMFWERLGGKYDIKYKKDTKDVLVRNLRHVVKFYDENAVFDERSEIKHMIATKQIEVDMEHELITNGKLDEIRRNLNG